MANIMLTEKCNLNCSYCFANEYVNRDFREITMENFRKAVSFICRGGDRTLGLIGGEPTLHTRFQDILFELNRNEAVRAVSLFTNGVLLDRFADALAYQKFSVLVNCNSPDEIGAATYQKILSNIELLIDKYGMRDQITLGVNLYRPDFCYSYLLEPLRRFGFRHVRMSLTVPNTKDSGACNSMLFFREMKPLLIRFVSDMLSAGIAPHYDCNKMPICLFIDEEKAAAVRLAERLPPGSLFPRGHAPDSSILSEEAMCSPVIDILPDLTAIRCFGLSTHTRVRIADFHDAADLRRFFVNEIDSYACKLCAREQCSDCYLHKTNKCLGGCLAYRAHDILMLRSVVEKNVQRLVRKERD